MVSEEGFSPRYDLDRWSGLISRPGHALEGHNIRDKILITPSAKGGIAAGWAFYDIQHKGIAPKAFVFGVTAAAARAASMLYVFGSMSTKTGVAPTL